MRIAVLGAGAFGTALAIALAKAKPEVTLWARDPGFAADMQGARQNARRLPGIGFPQGLAVTSVLPRKDADSIFLLAMPMQQVAGFLAGNGAALDGAPLVACAKGIDLATGMGPTGLIRAACPRSTAAILTGPSFAADLARGLPTALTLACTDDAVGAQLQSALSAPSVRLYRTDDVAGAEVGGALKNVIAIAAGAVIGGGLGESARAAIVTRGFAEMLRLATALGARPETLSGLSGLGDLVLTCTSPQSRNFRYGLSLGTGEGFAAGITVEGAATARATVDLAHRMGIEMPIAATVSALIDGRLTLGEAAEVLLSRPLKRE